MSNCLYLACDHANTLETKFCSQCPTKLLIQDSYRYRALRIIGQGGFGKAQELFAQICFQVRNLLCGYAEYVYNGL
jgi:hypothetical protein